jgi:ankyrin repeat protein
MLEINALYPIVNDVYDRLHGKSILSSIVVTSDISTGPVAIDRVKLLLHAGADPDQLDDGGLTARHYVAHGMFRKSSGSEVMDMLATLIPPAPIYDELNLTFLHDIVHGKYPLDLDHLFSTGDNRIIYDINSQTSWGDTPLHLAAAQGNAAMVRLLLQAGADPTIESVDLQTPLALAVRYNRLEVLQVFVEFSPNILRSKSAISWWCWASLHGDRRLADFLLQNNGDHAGLLKDGNGFSPVHMAAAVNNVEFIKALFEQGANLDPWDEKDSTPLFYAIRDRAKDALCILLEMGANYKHVPSDGGTIIHWVAHCGSFESMAVVEEARLKGLDIMQKDKWGYTAADYFAARQFKTKELEDAFQALLASIESDDEHGQETYGTEEYSSEEEEEEEE